MKSNIFILSINMVILFVACKDPKANTLNIEGDKIEEKISKTDVKNLPNLSIIKNMKMVSDGQIKEMQKSAIAILEHRQKESNKKAFIALDKDLWEYEFIFSGKEMTKPGQLAGAWIDFDKDLTYKYGQYDKVQGSGRYTYSIETGLLLLVDDSDNVKPQEFETSIADYTLIMDGNSVYRDNNYNGKLRRVQSIPIQLN